MILKTTKIAAALLCAGTLLTGIVAASSPSVTILLDGKMLAPGSAITENDRVLLPVREVCEDLGASVNWKEDAQAVIIEKNDVMIQIQLGNQIYTKNGQFLRFDVPPRLLDGKSFIPVRAVAEALQAGVFWNQKTRTVHIVSACAEGLIDFNSEHTGGSDGAMIRTKIANSKGTPELILVATNRTGKTIAGFKFTCNFLDSMDDLVTDSSKEKNTTFYGTVHNADLPAIDFNDNNWRAYKFKLEGWKSVDEVTNITVTKIHFSDGEIITLNEPVAELLDD